MLCSGVHRGIRYRENTCILAALVAALSGPHAVVEVAEGDTRWQLSVGMRTSDSIYPSKTRMGLLTIFSRGKEGVI